METKILKFSPASTTKVRLPGRGERGGEGRGGKGKGGEGEGRGGGEKGCSYPPPTSKCVATALDVHVYLTLQEKRLQNNYILLRLYLKELHSNLV